VARGARTKGERDDGEEDEREDATDGFHDFGM
jgi:hypothetical protein